MKGVMAEVVMNSQDDYSGRINIHETTLQHVQHTQNGFQDEDMKAELDTLTLSKDQKLESSLTDIKQLDKNCLTGFVNFEETIVQLVHVNSVEDMNKKLSKRSFNNSADTCIFQTARKESSTAVTDTCTHSTISPYELNIMDKKPAEKVQSQEAPIISQTPCSFNDSLKTSEENHKKKNTVNESPVFDEQESVPLNVLSTFVYNSQNPEDEVTEVPAGECIISLEHNSSMTISYDKQELPNGDKSCNHQELSANINLTPDKCLTPVDDTINTEPIEVNIVLTVDTVPQVTDLCVSCTFETDMELCNKNHKFHNTTDTCNEVQEQTESCHNVPDVDKQDSHNEISFSDVNYQISPEKNVQTEHERTQSKEPAAAISIQLPARQSPHSIHVAEIFTDGHIVPQECNFTTAHTTSEQHMIDDSEANNPGVNGFVNCLISTNEANYTQQVNINNSYTNIPVNGKCDNTTDTRVVKGLGTINEADPVEGVPEEMFNHDVEESDTLQVFSSIDQHSTHIEMPCLSNNCQDKSEINMTNGQIQNDFKDNSSTHESVKLSVTAVSPTRNKFQSVPETGNGCYDSLESVQNENIQCQNVQKETKITTDQYQTKHASYQTCEISQNASLASNKKDIICQSLPDEADKETASVLDISPQSPEVEKSESSQKKLSPKDKIAPVVTVETENYFKKSAENNQNLSQESNNYLENMPTVIDLQISQVGHETLPHLSTLQTDMCSIHQITKLTKDLNATSTAVTSVIITQEISDCSIEGPGLIPVVSNMSDPNPSSQELKVLKDEPISFENPSDSFTQTSNPEKLLRNCSKDNISDNIDLNATSTGVVTAYTSQEISESSIGVDGSFQKSNNNNMSPQNSSLQQLYVDKEQKDGRFAIESPFEFAQTSDTEKQLYKLNHSNDNILPSYTDKMDLHATPTGLESVNSPQELYARNFEVPILTSGAADRSFEELQLQNNSGRRSHSQQFNKRSNNGPIALLNPLDNSQKSKERVLLTTDDIDIKEYCLWPSLSQIDTFSQNESDISLQASHQSGSQHTQLSQGIMYSPRESQKTNVQIPDRSEEDYQALAQTGADTCETGYLIEKMSTNLLEKCSQIQIFQNKCNYSDKDTCYVSTVPAIDLQGESKDFQSCPTDFHTDSSNAFCKTTNNISHQYLPENFPLKVEELQINKECFKDNGEKAVHVLNKRHCNPSCEGGHFIANLDLSVENRDSPVNRRKSKDTNVSEESIPISNALNLNSSFNRKRVITESSKPELSSKVSRIAFKTKEEENSIEEVFVKTSIDEDQQEDEQTIVNKLLYSIEESITNNLIDSQELGSESITFSPTSDSPEDESVNPEAESISPEFELACPGAESVSPGAESKSPEAGSESSEAEPVSPEAKTVSTVIESANPREESVRPVSESLSPGAAESVSPGAAESVSPVTESENPGTESLSLVAESVTPGNESLSPRVESISPDVSSISPVVKSVSRDVESACPDVESISPVAESFLSTMKSYEECLYDDISPIPKKVRIIHEESLASAVIPDLDQTVPGNVEERETYVSLQCINEDNTGHRVPEAEIPQKISSTIFNWQRLGPQQYIIPALNTDDNTVTDGLSMLPSLAPLKTCSKPRRVGLSRRQRTQPLHSSLNKPYCPPALHHKN